MQGFECDNSRFDWLLASNFKHKQWFDCSCFEFLRYKHKHDRDYILEVGTNWADYCNGYGKLLCACSNSTEQCPSRQIHRRSPFARIMYYTTVRFGHDRWWRNFGVPLARVFKSGPRMLSI